MRLLLVEHREDELQALSTLLEEAGHDLICAQSGPEALDILWNNNVRIMIAAWDARGISGADLCRFVRSNRFPYYIYTILLTNDRACRDAVQGLSAGADDLIWKPFNPAELLLRIQTGKRILSLETRHVAVFALAKLAESRDPETGRHLERIRSYSRTLAEQLLITDRFPDSMSLEFVEDVFFTSPLHDIGKVGIPDSVLLKPGQLSDREFEIMKTHTAIGATTLAAAAEQYPEVEYLRIARDIALTHHEQYDGGGYPQGLKGGDIPVSGAIVALADVYDALTSKRVYKGALSHEVAKGVILEEEGKKFEPRIVEAFLEVEAEFVSICETLADDEEQRVLRQGNPYYRAEV
jgi:putative two-component system response regulator